MFQGFSGSVFEVNHGTSNRVYVNMTIDVQSNITHTMSKKLTNKFYDDPGV